MKFLGPFALLAALGLLAGCTTDADSSAAVSSDVTAAPALAMRGEWKFAPLPDGQSVEDFAVSKLIPDTRPASMFVVSRRTALNETYRNDLIISRSDDGGATFQTISLIPNAPWSAHIFVAPSDDRTIYVTAGGISTGMSMHDADGMLWKSTDGGVHFALSSAPDAPVSLDINPENPNHLVGATCNGVYRSLDGGTTFQRLDASPAFHCNYATIHRGKNDRNTMYVLYSVGEGGGSVLYRTTNGAGTWEETASGFGMGGFEIHPNDANHVYVFESERGWLSSMDGGKTLFPHNSSLSGGDGTGWFWDVQLSNVAFDTFTGAEPKLYVANNRVVKRWAPDNVPEGGRFVDDLAPAPAPLASMRFETMFTSLRDGEPSPALIGVTEQNGDEPRRLAIANLVVKNWRP